MARPRPAPGLPDATRRLLPLRLTIALVIATGGLGCSQEATPPAAPAAVAIDVATGDSGSELVPIAEDVPPLDAPQPPAPEEVAATPPAPASPKVAPSATPRPPRTAAATSASSTPATMPDPVEHVPLDSLFRAPQELGPTGPPPLDLEALRDAPVVTPAAEEGQGTIERLKSRLRIQRRSDSIGPAGPRQGTVSETDAGVSVPLDDSVSLEGGIRVDQRDEPGVDEPERKSTPRVGVQVKF